MPHTTVWNRNGITWNFSGRVTGEELRRANEELYRDPRFATIRYQIVDLTHAAQFEVAYADMVALAEADHAAARANPSVRVAVAASDELIRLLSLYYEAHSSDSPWDQQVFDTLGDAERWATDGTP